MNGDKPAKQKFKSYPLGYFHIDIAQVRTEAGQRYLFVAINRTSKFAYAEPHDRALLLIAQEPLRFNVSPFQHTVGLNT